MTDAGMNDAGGGHAAGHRRAGDDPRGCDACGSDACGSDLQREGISAARVAVIGGGLAGLAAAVALRSAGCGVTLFEARRYLGGRAASFRDANSGQWIDLCQHVSMGCCTNLADFCHRTGIQHLFRREPVLHFFAPDGRRFDLGAVRWLPAPLHLAPALWRLKYLSVPERIGIGRALVRLARTNVEGAGAEVTVADWLTRQGQSPAAIELFWGVVLVSASGESLERASLAAAQKVFVDGFLAAREAFIVEVPSVPLAEIYDLALRRWLADHQVEFAHGCRRPGRRSGRCGSDSDRAGGRRCASLGRGGDRRDLATNRRAGRTETRAAVALARRGPAARILADQRRAFVVRSAHRKGRSCRAAGTHQPVGLPSRPASRRPGRACRTLLPGRDQRLARAGRNRPAGNDSQRARRPGAVFPAACQAQLQRARVVTDPQAVFSVRPGSERLRPGQQTSVRRSGRCRRLDGHRLAGDDGRGCAQWLPGRRSRFEGFGTLDPAAVS